MITAFRVKLIPVIIESVHRETPVNTCRSMGHVVHLVDQA